MFLAMALLVAQMWLGEITRQRPKRTSFADFQKNNEPSELRPIPYVGGTIELTPSRMWYGDYRQRAVERDSHWTDYLWAGALAFLLDTITVGYRSYVGEMFPLCWGPDAHVERITIDDRPVFAAVVGSDNAGGGFLIDDPQAWGGDQPPGGGGEYAWCDLTRGNYSDHTNAYLEAQLTAPPNKTPSLRGISTLVKRGPSGFTESGYFFAGGVGSIPKFKLWKVTVRRQPDNLATGFNKIGRHMNPMEVIYEWATSIEYGARCPLEELNIDNWREVAQQLYDEENGWSGKIENAISPQAVIKDVLAQIDAVSEPSPSLGLTIRLVRRNYSIPSLRVLNRDNISRVVRFTPGTYEDTKNQEQVEFPDQDNNFKGRKALYTDPANQLIQDGRIVPETKTFLGVADFEQANVITTRDGRAISLPRAPLECFVFPSWGRLTYRGEVVLFEWESPSISMVMRVQSITPNGPQEKDFFLVLIEDQFATGLRTFGEPRETRHVDPGEGLDTAPPTATIDSLTIDFVITSTNEIVPTIVGLVTFGTYAIGGQYGRIYVTEPGGAQTLSPIYLAPDGSNQATFTWPANAVGEYEFCVQAYSIRGVTNGVKDCETIDVTAFGSPSLSPSHSVSPSASASVTGSPSLSLSPSSSVSPSHSASLSSSPSPSVSPSGSVSPSASTSPSSSASPSGFDPMSISGITEWVSGDQSSLSGLSNNDLVSTWLDRVAGIRSWSASGSLRPTFKTGGPNGLPYIRFDGTDTMSWSNTTSTIVSNTQYTMLVVLRPQQDGAADKNDAPYFFTDGGGQLGMAFKNDGSNRFGMYQRSGGSDGPFLGSTSTYTQNVWYIVEFYYDGTNINIKVNNDTPASTARGGFSNAFTPGIGANSIIYDVAERISYNVDMGSVNRTSVRDYLADKYAISIP